MSVHPAEATENRGGGSSIPPLGTSDADGSGGGRPEIEPPRRGSVGLRADPFSPRPLTVSRRSLDRSGQVHSLTASAEEMPLLGALGIEGTGVRVTWAAP